MNTFTTRAGTCRRHQPSFRWVPNRRRLTERRAVDPEAEAMVPEFVENRRADAAWVPRLVSDGEFREIGRLGHNMKGTGVSYGFPRIGEIGADMVVAAAMLDSPRILLLNDELRLLLDDLPHLA